MSNGQARGGLPTFHILLKTPISIMHVEEKFIPSHPPKKKKKLDQSQTNPTF
jgi:hypothetical protein